MTESNITKQTPSPKSAGLHAERLQCLTRLSQVRLTELHPLAVAAVLIFLVWQRLGVDLNGWLTPLVAPIPVNGATFTLAAAAVLWGLHRLIFADAMARRRQEKESLIRRIAQIDQQINESHPG